MIKAINKYSKILCYILAFIIPVIFMLIICSSLHFYPFEEINPVVADTKVQFISYFAYLKSVFYGNNDLFYSFSKIIGGDMAGFAFYYLGNPFIYLLLFVPNEMLPAGILYIIILIIGLSSLTFNIMLNNIHGFRWSSLLFSVSYGFIGYFMAYYNCILYFNNIMLLPIIVLGLYEVVVKEKKSFKYIIFLALTIITNYYIGYMTCIFSAIMFIYFYVVYKQPTKVIKKHINVVFNYVWHTLLAVMISMVALLTVVLSLRGQKIDDGYGLSIPMGINFPMKDVFSGLYTISFNGNISDGLPIIYCGTLVLAFIMLFFINNEIKIKEKIVSLIAMVIMLLSFYIKALNLIWHGLREPVGFPYRNSFFLSFLIILIAYRGFMLMKQGTRKYHTLVVFSIFIIYSLYMVLSHNAYVGKLQIILTGSFLAMILSGVYAICYKREYMYPITIGFFLILAFEVVINGYWSISKYYGDLENQREQYDIARYQDFYNENKEIVDLVNTDNGKLGNMYRMEKLYRDSHNDAMLLSYNGLSHYSSCESGNVIQFMDKLGFTTDAMWSYYGCEGNTAFLDSLFSVKYLISQFDETSKPYDYLDVVNNKFIFKNPYVLDMANAAKEGINDIDLDEYNHFTIQNAIAKGITGEVYGIYRPVEVKEIKLVNVEKYEKTYTRIDSSADAYVEYDLLISSNDFIYGYFNAEANQLTDFTVNDLQKEDYFNTYNWSTRGIGYFNPGEIIPVRIYLNQDEIEIDSYEFYYESKEELERFYNDAKKSVFKTKKVTSSHIITQANVADDEDIVFYTMPYDKGWKVKVDGKEVEPKPVMGVLLGIDIQPGTHIIDMQYTPQGLLVGSIISGIGIVVLLIIYIFERRRIRKLLKGE